MTSPAISSSDFAKTVRYSANVYAAPMPWVALSYPAKGRDDKLASLIRTVDGILASLLEAPDRQSFLGRTQASLARFVKVISALDTLLGDESGSSLDEEGIETFLVNAATYIGGSSAGDELGFCHHTYGRAVRLAVDLPDSELSDEQMGKDSRLAQDFNTYSMLHIMGTMCILHAEKHVPRPTEAGLEGSFEIARIGAMHAYAAAREALRLRKNRPAVADDEFTGGFDDEDARLAGVGRVA